MGVAAGISFCPESPFIFLSDSQGLTIDFSTSSNFSVVPGVVPTGLEGFTDYIVKEEIEYLDAYHEFPHFKHSKLEFAGCISAGSRMMKTSIILWTREYPKA